MPSTHTYAILKISKEAFEEIAGKLMEADYIHCFHRDGAVIDMHGIALQAAKPEQSVPREIRVTWPELQGRPRLTTPFLVDPETVRQLGRRVQAATRRPVSRIPRDK